MKISVGLGLGVIGGPFDGGLAASNVAQRGGRRGVERRWSRRVLFGELREKRGEPAEHVGQYEMVVVVT
jgi:hypothetical protein